MNASLKDAVAGLVVTLPFLAGAAAVPASEAPIVFTFADREIDESSGLAIVDGLVVTVNDSGDSGRVFTVDPATGRTVGITSWAPDPAEPVDDEALAPGPDGTVWVGDIGDNLARRDQIVARRVPVGRGDRTVRPPTYTLVYPDGPRDAETLLTDPTTGRLYVASKSLLGGTLYAAPVTLDPAAPNRLEAVGSVLGIATDGAFLPDGQSLVVRDYGRAVVYAWPSLEPLDTLTLPSQKQGESLAVDPADPASLLIGSEGVGSTVLRVALPDAPSSSSSSSPSSSPSDRPATQSREDRELPESTATERAAWPWFLGGWLGVGFLVLLLRSLRKPTRR